MAFVELSAPGHAQNLVIDLEGGEAGPLPPHLVVDFLCGGVVLWGGGTGVQHPPGENCRRLFCINRACNKSLWDWCSA